MGQGGAAALSSLSEAQADVSAAVDQVADRQRRVPTYVPTDRRLTLADAANYLAVSIGVVEELAAGRAFRVLRIGEERRVRREDLEDYLQSADE